MSHRRLRWLDHVTSTAGCSRPTPALRPRSRARTGAILTTRSTEEMPGGGRRQGLRRLVRQRLPVLR